MILGLWLWLGKIGQFFMSKTILLFISSARSSSFQRSQRDLRCQMSDLRCESITKVATRVLPGTVTAQLWILTWVSSFVFLILRMLSDRDRLISTFMSTTLYIQSLEAPSFRTCSNQNVDGCCGMFSERLKQLLCINITCIYTVIILSYSHNCATQAKTLT